MVDRRSPRTPGEPRDDPMRVALDVGPLYGHRTGVGVACAGMLASLDARDDVAVTPYLTSFRSRPDATHHRLPLPGIVASHLWARVDVPRADRWLGPAEVVHGTNYVAPPTSRPVVVSVYDCWFLRHTELATPLVRRAGRTLRRAISRGAWIHASSEATAAEVRELLGTDRVRPILLGPPREPSRPIAGGDGAPTVVARLGDRPFVVALGTEERRKGLPLLVEAFATLARDVDDVHLILAGATGDDSDAVEAAIAALAGPVRDRVVRLGRVDAPTKSWLLERAAALAYPSLDEGFGFPVVEAQAAATPVVATAVGSIPEVAGAGAELVEAGDTDAIAAALQRVLTDDSRRSELIAAGSRNLTRFSWDATAGALVDLYRIALEDP